MKPQRSIIVKEWFTPPANNAEYEKIKFSIPYFPKKIAENNRKIIASLKKELAHYLKKEKIRVDVILYGSQLYFPSLEKDVDIFMFYETTADAKKLNKLFGGELEPVLSSNIVSKQFTLFRLNRVWKGAQISAGLIDRKSFEKSLELGFNVSLTCIRPTKPQKPSVKRVCFFDGRTIWFPVRNKSKSIGNKTYWLRQYPSWLLLEESLVPASVPFYLESMISGEIIYSSNPKRLDSNLHTVLELTKTALSEFRSKQRRGKLDNIFTHKRVFPNWFKKKLRENIRRLESI